MKEKGGESMVEETIKTIKETEKEAEKIIISFLPKVYQFYCISTLLNNKLYKNMQFIRLRSA